MNTEFKVKDKKPAKVPAWHLGFAIKTVILSIAGPILVLVLILVSINIFPESKELIRRNFKYVHVVIAAYYLLFLGYMALRLKNRRHLLKDLGLNAFPVWTAIKYLLAFPIVYISSMLIIIGFVVMIASLLGYSLPAEQVLPDKEKRDFSWTIFIIVSFIVPIVEELVMRGILLPAWVQKKGWLKGSVYSSLIFSLLHGPTAPFLFIPSLYISRLYYRTGSIIPGIILHMANNAFVSLVVLM